MPHDYDNDRPRPYDRHAGEPAGSRRPGRGTGGGIPDGLLLVVLGFLLGLSVLTWTATGLAGLFAHGSWPKGVVFTRSPMAIRALVTQPHDIADAWPDASPAHLSGYGLFWGLLIGQLLIALVLTIFVMGTVTRARAVRAARRAQRATYPRPTERPAATNQDVRAQPTLSKPTSPDHAPATGRETQPESPTSPRQAPDPARPADAVPTAVLGPVHQPVQAAPAGQTPEGASADPRSRVHDAAGAVLVATSDPALWAATKDARAKLGPVHLFDPGQLCDTPDRLRWSPHHGCTDRATAAARATAMLAPLRSPRPIDAETHTAAEVLLRCWLHAAALDDRPFREVHRWALAKSAPTDPVQTLRTHPKAMPGAAGELEATLTGHPERRHTATELIRRALSPLSRLHIRNACTAARADRISLESFIDETGTLYVVGEEPELMPILNALTQSVVEHGRRMAARSSPGRLDPPLTTVLQLPLSDASMPAQGTQLSG